MTHSDVCTHMVAGFEGIKLNAYLDGNGIPTIGYGHTQGVQMGDTCTQQEALQWLSDDLGTADDAVNRLVTVPLNQNQYDALVSFTYNVGQGHLQHSTLLDLLNQGAYVGASAQFLAWNKIGGVESKGLTNRRLAERALFDTPEASNAEENAS